MSEILVNTIKKADGTGSLTVPAETGAVLTSGTALSSFPSGFANGITNFQMWRLSATTSLADGDVISSNWEKADTRGYGELGNDLTVSSGIFTFPETGFWFISFFAEGNRTDANTQFMSMLLDITEDNSLFYDVVKSRGSVSDTNYRVNLSGNYIFDVTDTSTHKIRFRMDTAAGSGTEFLGASDKQITGFSAIRLGDT